MGTNSKQAYNAEGREELLTFYPENLVIVGLDNEAPEGHPLIDSERLKKAPPKELIANIKHFGVKVPITIRKNIETGDIEVVNGRRRVRALREANKEREKEGLPKLTVAARREMSKDKSGATLSMAIGNEFAEGETVLSRARRASMLLSQGVPKDEVAMAFGVSTRAVDYWMQTLECTPAVQKAIENDEVSVDVARELSALEPAEQKARLEELKKAGLTHGTKAAEAVRRSKKNKTSVAETSPALSKPELKFWASELESLNNTGEYSDEDEQVLAVVEYVLGEPKRLRDAMPATYDFVQKIIKKRRRDKADRKEARGSRSKK